MNCGTQPNAESAGRPLPPVPAAGDEPLFFREAHHFSQLAVRARAMARRRTSLNVWCCGCRSGEDAYSAAMALREGGCHGEVLATDADETALAVGRRGMYRLADVLPAGHERLQRHFFVRGTEEAHRVALVRGEVRSMVRFVLHTFPGGARLPEAPFDFILCRGSLSALDGSARRRAIDQMVEALLPGGVLFLGQADSFGVSHPQLLPCGRTAFERSGSSR
ncbi:MAG TPA: CheR family methyltransferase [Burkholderiales bacterium]|nr:CheR family methyltransferase [Burkholderiales bacterium]